MRTLIAITLSLLPLFTAGASAQETPAPAPAAAVAPVLQGEMRGLAERAGIPAATRPADAPPAPAPAPAR